MINGAEQIVGSDRAAFCARSWRRKDSIRASVRITISQAVGKSVTVSFFL